MHRERQAAADALDMPTLAGLTPDSWLTAFNMIDLGECKWGGRGAPKALEDELRAKVKHLPNPDNASIGLRISTRKRLDAPATNVHCHCLEDLTLQS